MKLRPTLVSFTLPRTTGIGLIWARAQIICYLGRRWILLDFYGVETPRFQWQR